jgi:hypothetical protein
MPTLNWLTAMLLFTVSAAACVAQEQYPKALAHSPTDHPAARVILLSIDGLHAFDLVNWIAAHPASTLAQLSAHGVTYTNAHAPLSNPAAGLLALVTGGTPISTGIISSNGYDHALSPPGSGCKVSGTELKLDGVDGSAPVALDALDGCKPLAPHDLVRVNTIFEVVREKIGPTAWAGEDVTTTDLLRGPSAKGLTAAHDYANDSARLNAVLRWIDDTSVPILFGMSFRAVAESQERDGYLDALGTPSEALAKSMQSVDDSIGSIVRELKSKQLFDSTWIAVASPYGQSPMDRRQLALMPLGRIRSALEAKLPGNVVHMSGGDAAMIWLRDSEKTVQAVTVLSDAAPALGIQEIYWDGRPSLTLGSPAKDSRMPDIILQPRAGVIWTPQDTHALMFHGGMLDQDTHVALMLSGVPLTGRSDPTYVPTTQLAPLLLRALGIEKFDLRALHVEHSPALPGIF